MSTPTPPPAGPLTELAPQDAAHAANQRVVLVAIAAIAVLGVTGAFVCVLTHTPIPDPLWGLVAGDVGILGGMLINTRPGASSTVVVASNAQPNGDASGQPDSPAGETSVTYTAAPEVIPAARPVQTRRRPSPRPTR